MKYKQKKKQNQRILEITEQTLVVGADVAKETHVARAVEFRGIELGKDLVFANSGEGFKHLVTWMKDLKRQYAKRDVIFGIHASLSLETVFQALFPPPAYSEKYPYST